MKDRASKSTSESGRRRAAPTTVLATELAQQVSFDFLGEELGRDVEQAIVFALQQGAHFPGSQNSPLTIFQEGLAGCLHSLQGDKRWILFKRFLTQGPMDPQEESGHDQPTDRLSDDETFSVICYIYHRISTAFQGLLAELLAAAPCTQLLIDQQRSGRLPRDVTLYCGDAVLVPQRWSKTYAKGADFHYFAVQGEPIRAQAFGVAEVKSYVFQSSLLAEQIEKHIGRLQSGVKLDAQILTPSQIHMQKDPTSIFRVKVGPSYWRLSRMFHFRGDYILVKQKMPPSDSYKIERQGPSEWQITLRWSHESLAAVAHEMTFWYMGKVGEEAFKQWIPQEWEGMTPIEAGQNAAKSSLYYAILRSRNHREESKAIALYNSYGFGYSLGMNFKDREGRRQMLWAEDLHEILKSGVTTKGHTIWQK